MFRKGIPRRSPAPGWFLKAAGNQEAAAMFQLRGICVLLSLLWSLLALGSSMEFGSENQASVQREVLLKAFKHFL